MAIEIVEREINVPEEYLSFVEENIGTLKKCASNCLGTGLYCSGEIDGDVYMWGEEANGILDGLSEVDNPQRGLLVAWKRFWNASWGGYYSHSGIITHVDPVLVTYRDGNYAPVIHNKMLEIVNAKYLTPDAKTKFLIPRKLEAMI